MFKVNFIIIVITVMLIVGSFASVSCDNGPSPAAREQLRKDKEWNEPCASESVLVATTTGSPNSFKCTNKHHVMRVQVTTTKTNEEVGAIIFCECAK